jgi:hypothetical protein
VEINAGWTAAPPRDAEMIRRLSSTCWKMPKVFADESAGVSGGDFSEGW